MTRLGLVRRFVLDAIADDYESAEKIVAQVIDTGVRCGLTIISTEIFCALTDLIEVGLARAYRLSPWRPPEEIPGSLHPDEIKDLYFLITGKGMEIQHSDDNTWPFDNEGALQSDWLPPDE